MVKNLISDIIMKDEINQPHTRQQYQFCNTG